MTGQGARTENKTNATAWMKPLDSLDTNIGLHSLEKEKCLVLYCLVLCVLIGTFVVQRQVSLDSVPPVELFRQRTFMHGI